MDGDTVPGRLRVLAAYHPLLVRLARRQGAGAEAEDIASDALLLAALRGQVHTDAPLAYLSRIIDNLVIDRFRAEALRDRRYRRDTAPAPRALDDLVATRDLAARVLGRLRATEGSFTAWLVWRRVVDGLAWQELAAEVGLTPSSVQSRVWRALHRLRPWLRRQLTDRSD